MTSGSLPKVAPHRERLLAWAMNVVACLYYVWLFTFHWRNTTALRRMFEGLELPNATRFFMDLGAWLLPALALVFVIVTVAKELVVADKRLSMMITFFVALIAQFIAQVLLTAYYLPLFDIARQVR
jgi:hypothetical protein